MRACARLSGPRFSAPGMSRRGPTETEAGPWASPVYEGISEAQSSMSVDDCAAAMQSRNSWPPSGRSGTAPGSISGMSSGISGISGAGATGAGSTEPGPKSRSPRGPRSPMPRPRRPNWLSRSERGCASVGASIVCSSFSWLSVSERSKFALPPPPASSGRSMAKVKASRRRILSSAPLKTSIFASSI